ncbi:MAG: helicase HerA-like domain-containing protein [Candidatus Thorarchaeota archaeon]
MPDGKLWIGHYLDKDGNKTDQKFEISVDLLRKHGGVFGSTGSGKTVLCKVILEEAAMEGIPVLAFDPQGDIASLMLPGDPAELKSKGVDPALLKEYMEKVIVRVYTPASSKGLQISINPLKLPDKGADPDDMIRLLDNSARTLVKVLAKVAGLSQSWEAKSFAAVYELIRSAWERDIKIGGLAQLADLLVADPETAGVDLEPFMRLSERQKLAIAIRSLTVGSSQLLFREEGQVDFDQLVKPVNGKTPINVLFLKTLRSEEEKHFFIAIVLNQLYSWMLRQGFSEKPRLILFQDEAAPFIPAGMKMPGPKETFLLLFRQARKYGIECLIATQSPKDVDYKAFEQFNSIVAGRISSEQSLKVLERILEPIAGEADAEKIITALPGKGTGTFIFTSADLKPKVNDITTRWLLTRHTTLTEKDIQTHMAALIKEQERLFKEMERARIEEEKRREEEERRRREEEERRKEEEKRKKQEEEERKRQEEERRRQEEEERRAREAELREKREKFASAKDTDKVFDTRSRAGKVSYDDIMNGFVARIEAVAKTSFGLPFLRELVSRGELNYEKSMVFYLKETRAAVEQGLARLEKRDVKGKKVDFLIYDFEYVLDKVLTSMGVKEPEYVDVPRLKKKFESIVMKATASNILERIILGKPFLQF